MTAKKTSSLDAKLKALDPQVKKYVSYLEKENTSLELEVAKLKLKQKSLNLRIKALEKDGPTPDLGDRLRRARERVADPDPRFPDNALDLLKLIKPNPVK